MRKRRGSPARTQKQPLGHLAAQRRKKSRRTHTGASVVRTRPVEPLLNRRCHHHLPPFQNTATIARLEPSYRLCSRLSHLLLLLLLSLLPSPAWTFHEESGVGGSGQSSAGTRPWTAYFPDREPSLADLAHLESDGWTAHVLPGGLVHLEPPPQPSGDTSVSPETAAAASEDDLWQALYRKLSARYGAWRRDFYFDVDAEVTATIEGADEDAGSEASPLVVDASCCWHLDRIDQRDLPLNQIFRRPATDGAGVDIYVVDTGVQPHAQFGSRLVQEFTLYPLRSDYDCNGHGTHVGGIAAGSTYGVARNATVRAVRVLDCSGTGSVSGVAAGINALVANSQSAGRRPGVINLSLATNGFNEVLDAAVRGAIQAGFLVVAAAGNAGGSACSTFPAATSGVVSVGASTSLDARASYSNLGSCVDLYAPGSSVKSSYIGSSTATATLSGTSMACPVVAGFGAQVLGASQSATRQTAIDQLLALVTTNRLSNLDGNSYNRLLYLPSAFSLDSGGTTTTGSGAATTTTTAGTTTGGGGASPTAVTTGSPSPTSAGVAREPGAPSYLVPAVLVLAHLCVVLFCVSARRRPSE